MPAVVPDSPERTTLTEDERAALWRQYAQAHAGAQETFDSTIRALAAGGVAVTVTLATAAIDMFNTWGIVAVAAFLLSLAFNVGSFATAQQDMRMRLEFVRTYDVRGFEETGWTTATFSFNVLAGTFLMLGGALLGVFVWSTT